jgi:plasmid stabilization system protein ParE
VFVGAIFYLHTGEEVQILAVHHGARDLSSIVAERVT